MDRFQDLETFIAVVETGSFTQAAERLGTAKSAVSRRISTMEARLGVELLRRTTRRLSLTDTGKSFYEQSTRILADLDEAESAVMQAHGELKGLLRVALPLSFGLRHMARPVAEFARRHPGVTFDLDLNDRQVDLVDEGMDLALRIGKLRDSSLIARRLFDVSTVLVASPEYLDAEGVPRTPAELPEHRFLVYSNLAEPTRLKGTGGDGERFEVNVSASLSASNGDFITEQAVAGRGIALQPEFIVRAALDRGELIHVLADCTWPGSSAYAVYPPTRHLSYRVRAFIDFLAEWFSDVPDWGRPLGPKS